MRELIQADEEDFRNIERAIFTLEEKFKYGNRTRYLLYRLRCECGKIVQFNRVNKDYPQKAVYEQIIPVD